MKKCTKCKIEKSLTEFNFKNKKIKKYQSACKLCSREAGRKHYNKNSAKVVAKVALRNKSYHEKNKKWKSFMKCSMCNENSTACIDFHHINPEEKIIEVSQILHNSPLGVVIKEARKCIVICSNCHRKIHANEIEATIEHKLISDQMMDNAYALVNPLASNQ